MHNVSKLPKWAQQEIFTLTNQLVGYKERARLAAEETTETDTFIRDYDLETPDEGLPPGSSIKFRLGSGGEIEVRVARKKVLHIMATTGRLVIRPCVSNVVEISTER